ncbi:TetR family transcriptional regulator [Nocardiopsis gilva YIM 90087]|uniref:TetR family transcriptional regulator n=1 Tax=Nocardiopsis gilva YIM 90087 TaxID=1235441 RepID=A0A223SCJ9_9ACTN|nr:TetR/AcrR family transcriptional regulator [Nocardiopsis gilva]ASU85830.1 TetR family transcriptional regulator [Nocardiopsis gilva YIM 90087]
MSATNPPPGEGEALIPDERSAAEHPDGPDQPSAGGTRGRGRPRNPAIEEAVLKAVRHRLASDGYARMSIADVAADAGVTRPTIYRRWPTKIDLVTAAVDYALSRVVPLLPPPDSERSAFDELVDVLRLLNEAMTSPDGGFDMISATLAERKQTPELIALIREHGIEPRQAFLEAALRHGQDRGEVRDDLDLDTIGIMLQGSLFQSYLRTGEFDPDLPRRIVNTIWPAIAAR